MTARRYPSRDMIRLQAEELAAINARRVRRVDSAVDVLLAVVLGICCAMLLAHAFAAEGLW